MAPKKETKAKKKASELQANEEKLQAVVLTDSYETRFMPLTKDTPRCLLPLANSPLIEYTLEFLATANVGEVYLMCCSHSEQVEEHIQQSKWNSQDSPFRVKTVASPESQSVGDVMRDLDTKGVIKKDFLLISGDVVCNLDFEAVLKAHNDRKQKDRNAIMTMVLREATGMHRTRPRLSPGVFVLDESNGRCLRYEAAKTSGELSLDVEVLQEHDSVAFRNDLIDCQIDICTVDVPALFQENFDYDKLRGDFVRGILTSDLLGKTIYAHIVNDQYAARVQSLQTYDAISKDLIARFVYPIAPDSNLRDSFTYYKGHIYKEPNVVLAQSSYLKSNSVIGSGTKIGDKTVVNKSTVGRDCVIGEDVVLENAYVWHDSVIEGGARIINSIVANSAVVKQGSVLENVIVSHGLSIEGTISKTKFEKGDNGEPVEYEEESEDEEEEGNLMPEDGIAYQMSQLKVTERDLPEETMVRKKKTHHRTASHGEIIEEDDEEEEVDDSVTFRQEVEDSMQRSIKERHTIDVAALELSTLRMTMDASYEDMRQATAKTLVDEVLAQIAKGKAANKATETVFLEWAPLLQKQILEPEDQVHLIQMLAERCEYEPKGDVIFVGSLVTLYDEDVIEEDYVDQWVSTGVLKTGFGRLKAKFDEWYNWLKTAESESESE